MGNNNGFLGRLRAVLVVPFSLAIAAAVTLGLAMTPQAYGQSAGLPDAPYSITPQRGPLLQQVSSTDNPGGNPRGRRFSVAAPEFYLGFLIPNRGEHGQFLSIEANGTAAAGLMSVDHRYPQQALWAGFSEMISTRYGTDLDFLLQGWVMVPSTVKGSSTYTFAGNTLGTARSWTTKSQAWILDGAVLFSWTYDRPDISQINGIRYEYYNRCMGSPGPPIAGPAPWPWSESDTVELEAKTWIPYIGIQYAVNGPAGLGLMRFTVSPFVFGTLDYNEYWRGGAGRHTGTTFVISQGLFFEFLAIFERSFSSHGSAGFFLKMDHTSAYGNGNLESSAGGIGQEASDYRTTYRQIAYTFGATGTLRFSSPF